MMDYFSSNVGSIQLAVPRVAPQVGGYADDTNVADTTYVRIPSNIIREGISPAIPPRGFYDYTSSILPRGFFTYIGVCVCVLLYFLTDNFVLEVLSSHTHVESTLCLYWRHSSPLRYQAPRRCPLSHQLAKISPLLHYKRRNSWYVPVQSTSSYSA
jgi:hypothetical protein